MTIKSENQKYDIIVLGLGPAGYSAAIYAKRGGKTCVIIGQTQGGQLATTSLLDNYSGFFGPAGEIIDIFFKQANWLSIPIISKIVSKLWWINNRKVILTCEGGLKIDGKCLIICSGSKIKLIWFLHDNDNGIHYCATCDGFDYLNENVVVLGGGSKGFEDAIYLSGICKSVTLLHRGSSYKSEKILQEILKTKNNVKCFLNTTITRSSWVWSDESLNLIIKEKSKEPYVKNVKGLFVAIGSTPNSKFCSHIISVSESGHIISWDTRTKLENIFVAGDVTDNIYRQAIIAAGDGAKAGMNSVKLLNDSKL